MKKDIIAITSLAFVLFMLFAQAIPILDGDTAFYATIAKNIVKSGDWMTLKFVSADDIIDKPPLTMWMMAASFKIFGINEFALSLWHAILAVITVVLTYLIGYDLIGRRGAMLSALVLMLSAQFFYITRTPMLDIPLAFSITLALFGVFRLFRTSKPSYYYLIAASCAGGVLTKGPVGLAIPLLSFLVYMTISKNFKPLISLHILSSAILFLFIVSPWFIIEYRILGRKFADIFFSRNLFRFLRPTDVIGDIKSIEPQYDFYSYFAQIFLLFAPWSGFVYPAVFYAFKKKEMRLPLTWSAVAVFLFAFSLNYKIGRYILPAFPALSIVVADLIDHAIANIKEVKKYALISAWLNLAILIPLLTLSTVFLFMKFPAESLAFRPIALPFLVIFSIGVIAGTILIFAGKIKNSIVVLTAFTAIAYMVFITTGALFINEALPTKALCAEINKLAKPVDAIIIIKSEDPRQEYFYLNNKLTHIRDIKELHPLISKKIKIYGITQDKNINKTKVKILNQINGYYLFVSK